MIKSFRGKLDHNTTERIKLSTNDGLTGYRIVKMELMAHLPGTTNYENLVKLFSTPQETVDGTVDFTDPTLLGVAYLEGRNENHYQDQVSVIFDNIKFNQDIYITHFDVSTENKIVNYYIELEQVKLNINEATVATLKDMRGRE